MENFFMIFYALENESNTSLLIAALYTLKGNSFRKWAFWECAMSSWKSCVHGGLFVSWYKNWQHWRPFVKLSNMIPENQRTNLLLVMEASNAQVFLRISLQQDVQQAERVRRSSGDASNFLVLKTRKSASFKYTFSVVLGWRALSAKIFKYDKACLDLIVFGPLYFPFFDWAPAKRVNQVFVLIANTSCL